MTTLLPPGLTFKNALNVHVTFNEILKKCSDLIQSIDNYETLRKNPELILLACDLVEYNIPKNTSSFDKKELVVSILDKVFTLTDDEKNDVRTTIQFLYDHNRIKGVPFIKSLLYSTKCYIFRVFGLNG